MEDADIGVVWDVLSKDFATKPVSKLVDDIESNERILYGGPIISDLSKQVGSVGELLLNTISKFNDKVAFVSGGEQRGANGMGEGSNRDYLIQGTFRADSFSCSKSFN